MTREELDSDPSYVSIAIPDHILTKIEDDGTVTYLKAPPSVYDQTEEVVKDITTVGEENKRETQHQQNQILQ